MCIHPLFSPCEEASTYLSAHLVPGGQLMLLLLVRDEYDCGRGTTGGAAG